MDTDCVPVCRVCMVKSPEFVDFDIPLQNEDEEDTNITYLDFFFECTRIEVELYEGASQCFCLSCGDELRSFYKFLKIAQKSDYLFRTRKKKFGKSSTTTHKITETKNENTYVRVRDKELGNLLDGKKKHEEEIVYDIYHEKDEIQFILEDTGNKTNVDNGELINLKVEPFVENKLEVDNANVSKSCLSPFSENRDRNTQTIQTYLKNKKIRKGPAECAFCHEILPNQKLLENHLVEEHQRRTKPCHLCGKMVIRLREHLMIHEREKNNIQRPKTECPICFRMISKQTISRHIRQVHQFYMKNHKCLVCSQTFEDSHKLKVHVLKGYCSNTNMKCILCPRTFSNGISLNNHLRKHSCLERISKK